MNARLLTLGMLHRGDLHPYEMKRRLRAAMTGCYLDAVVGTLYYAVRQLENDGHIVAVAHERVARGGMRTIYRITAAGREEFERGFFAQLEDDAPVAQALYGALLFLHCVAAGPLIDALRRRIGRLDTLIEKTGALRSDIGPLLGTGSSHLLDHIAIGRRHDRQWLAALIADLESNGIRDAAPLASTRALD